MKSTVPSFTRIYQFKDEKFTSSTMRRKGLKGNIYSMFDYQVFCWPKGDLLIRHEKFLCRISKKSREVREEIKW